MSLVQSMVHNMEKMYIAKININRLHNVFSIAPLSY